MPTYPAQIDTTQSLPTAIDNFTPVQGAIFNRLRDAVIAIETALGANPAASYGTLAARLGVFESTLGNLQLIELQKDLGGTLENPFVIGLQGRPLSSAIPAPGEILQWNGIAWVPSDVLGHQFFFAGGDLAGDGYTQRVIGLQSFPLSPTSPLPGQVLQWNGTNWLPATISLATTLIYQPGGVATGNVYTSWTALMTARALIDGPTTIVVDDSIVSPALVDVGIWDLTHNTNIIGYKGNQNTPNQGVGSSNLLPNLGIPNGAQLFNPTYFQDLTITGFNTGSLFSIDSGAQPAIHNGSMNFTAYNVIFQNDVTATKPLIHTNGGVMDFYGGCHLISSNGPAYIISNTATQPVIMNLHDNTIVDGYTLFFSAGTTSLTINVGPQATYGTSQVGISIVPTVNGGNFIGSWSTAANGTILTKTGSATADWLSASAGGNQLIYQPGGSNSSTTYTSWSALMTARAAIPGLVDILIDDSFGSPNIDVGAWDLQNNTRLFGRRGKQNAATNSNGLTRLNLPGGAYLNNPYEFRDLLITGATTSATTTISFPSSGANLPQSTINVSFTTGFPSSGTIRVATSVGISTVTYTGITGSTFTGCSGGTGQLSAGGVVNQHGPNIDFAGANLNVAVNFYNCYLTVIGVGITGITSASNLAVLPQTTINVTSTAGFPSSGTVLIESSNGIQAVNYTGTTAFTFTGCTGGSGTLTGGTTIAVGSNGAVLPQATINVASTTNFPSFGTILVTSSLGTYTITYTGTTGTSFTGCTGGVGTLSTGNAVVSTVTDIVAPLLHIGSNTSFANNTNVNLYENTTVVSPAAITTTFTGITNYPLPPTGGILNVASTTGFPASGSILLTNSAAVLQLVTYTGITSNTFTGCTGGSGTLVNGTQVYSPNPVFHNASTTNTYINLYDSSNVGAGTVQFATVFGVNSVVLHVNVNSPAVTYSYLQPFITGNGGNLTNYKINVTALSQAYYTNVVMTALGNVTLTPAQYNASDIAVTSQLNLGITYNIVMPLIAGRSWIVANQTQFGGQALQFIGSSGTGFTVANGASALIWTDGTNFYGVAAGSSGITALTGDVSASGSGSVAATVTGLQSHPVSSTAPTDGFILTWIAANNDWEPRSPSSVIALGKIYEFSNTASDISTYDQLLDQATGAEADLSIAITSGSGQTLIKSFASVVGSPDVSYIPAGLWDFDYYAYVSAATGTTTLTFTVYKRTNPGGVETQLFTVTTPNITNTTVAAGTVTFSLSTDTIVNTTDRIVVKVLAQTTSGSSVTVHYVFDGTLHTSHVHTPIPGTAVALGGDLSGTTAAATVIKINGATVPVSGALTTGNVLQVNGISSLTYGALNLAGGANFVTGNLPITNVAPGTSAQVLMSNATPATTWTTLSGDMTVGATGTTTVSKINGTSVPATPSANQVLVATAGTTATWQQIVDAQVSATAAIAGSKINPTFGAQAVSTTSTLASGTHTISGTLAWGTNFPPAYGYLTIAMSDANTTPTGSQYNNGELAFTGTLTAQRNIVLPLTAGADWIIYNHTTGGQNLQVIGSSGTGFIIPNGTSALVWTDGTNFYGVGGGSVTFAGDLSGTTSTQTVTGIRNNSVPSPTGSSTVLTWSGSTFSWTQAGANNIVNPQVSWSPVDIFQTGTVTEQAGNFTVGTGFTAQAQLTITGVRTYWAGATTQTLKASLWTSGGIRLAIGTLIVSAAGVYTIPFTSAYTMLSTDKDALLYVSIWETSGTNYTRTTQASVANIPAQPFIAGPYLTLTTFHTFIANDAVPTTNSGTEYYMVEPVFSGITGVGVHTPNITGTYTVTAKDQYIPVSTSGGSFTITAPLLPVLGQQFIIADVGGTMSTNNLTIAGNGNNILTPAGSATTVNLSTNWDQTVFTYNGTTWSMTLNGSFTAGGDLTGGQSAQTVVALRGKSLASSLSTIGAGQDGFVLSWVNANNDWEAKVAPSGSFSAGGDLAGTAGSQQVTGITGAAGVVSITAALQGSTGGSGTPLHESITTIAMSDANYTLSASDMAKPIIEFTGTLTANRSILCPTSTGAKFTISNKTTGGFILTVHRADGADVGVPVYNGQNVNVYYDGSNDNAYEATSVNGTVAVQGGGSPIKSLYIYGFPGINQTNSATFVNGATFEFDPTTLNAANGTRTIKLRVIAETTAPLMTIQLFNFTTTTVVTGSTLTTSGTSPTTLVTGDLTANLSNSLAIYQVQIKMAAGTGTDRVTLDAAKLQIDWS
jgi:hypothetical protein